MFQLDSPLNPVFKHEINLPLGLSYDPFSWNNDEVITFLDYCEHEYDLESVNRESVRMNGKALCLLTSTDLAKLYTQAAGYVVHNVLQSLIAESRSNEPIATPNFDEQQQLSQQSARSIDAENSEKSDLDGSQSNSLLTILYKESTPENWSESSEFDSNLNQSNSKQNSFDAENKYGVRVKLEPIPFEEKFKSHKMVDLNEDSGPARKRQRLFAGSISEGESSQFHLTKSQNDNQNQPKSAEKMTKTQEPLANDQKGIHDLNQEQLVNIFKWLDFPDLLNVANTTKKLREAAAAIYSDKYSDLVVSYSEDASNSQVELKTDTIEVKEARTCLKVFRGFGSLIKTVQLNFDGVKQRRCQLISQKLNEYCAETLVHLSWFHCPADAMHESSKKFEKLQILRMKHGYLGEQMSQFNHFFPALVQLDLDQIEVTNRKCIENTIPTLALLKVNIEPRKKLDFQKSNVKAALKVNPQLKGLALGSGCQPTLLKYINMMLAHLQILEIHNPCKQFFDSDEQEKVCFNEVRTVSLTIADSKDLFKNIPFKFPRLRKFTLNACAHHRDEWIDFVVGHPTLVKLHLLNFHWFRVINSEQLMKIVSLTMLKYFVLDWRLLSKNILLRFLKRCKSLNELRVTVKSQDDREAICALVKDEWQTQVDGNVITLKRSDD